MFIDFKYLSPQEKVELKKAIEECGFEGGNIPTSIPFSTEIPLDGNYIMDGFTVTQAITFSPKGKRIAGSSCYIRLVQGDQSPPTPTMAGMAPASVSTGFNGQPGSVTFLTIYYDGMQVLYKCDYSQIANDPPASVVTSASVNFDTGQTQNNALIISFTQNLSPLPIPEASKFIVISGGISIMVNDVEIIGETVYLSLNTPVTYGDTTSVSYLGSDDYCLTDSQGYTVSSFTDLPVVTSN